MKRVAFSVWILSTVTAVTGSPASEDLMDPTDQPVFEEIVRNPLDPAFIYNTSSGIIEVGVSRGGVETGLVAPDGSRLVTPIWGYGTEELGYTWPGFTFEQRAYEPLTVIWHNRLVISEGYLLTGKNNSHLGTIHDFTSSIAVDDSFHWAYSMHGYHDYTIATHGTPIVPHLHGGHTDAAYDGNSEYFFSPGFGVNGPQFTNSTYHYDNSQASATLWYHDHALGITRLNVYSGMAGFYILRDSEDTGLPGNLLKLPTYPYEIPLAIQDRMFKENGELFYPSFHGDPYWEDFIEGEGATIGEDDSSAMAEFFGDFIVVNGNIWPKLEAEPRKYRLRLLNGCDSRFLAVEFMAVNITSIDPSEGDPVRVPFWVIGADQGMGNPVQEEMLLIGPAQRFDIIIDFAPYNGQRIIMKNSGGDEPFGGDLPGPQVFALTDRVMAFDVVEELDDSVPDDWTPPAAVESRASQDVTPDNVRRIGLFEGRDQFGRLQPLLGTIDPATDMDGNPICYPDTSEYKDAGLVGQMMGTQPWHAPTTENIKLNDVEDWEIWNLSADAHPIHLHLVSFILIKREYIKFESTAIDGNVEPEELGNIAGDGTYFTYQPMVQHDGSRGEGYYVVNPTKDLERGEVPPSEYTIYADGFSKDTIIALPNQVTTIRAKFDKPGTFGHHCHILSHEDHEMMRIFHVGPLPENLMGGSCPQDPEKEGEGSQERDSAFSLSTIFSLAVSIFFSQLI